MIYNKSYVEELDPIYISKRKKKQKKGYETELLCLTTWRL